MRTMVKPGTAIFGNIFRRLMQRRVALLLLFATSAHALLMLTFSLSERNFAEVTVNLFLAVALPVTALITAGASLGDEREENTMPFLLVKPLPRWVVAVSSLLASISTVVVVSLVGIALAWFLGARATGDNMIGWPMLVAMIIVAVAYSAVFVPVGLVARRSTLIGLAYILIWEGIISSVVDGAAASSIWRIGLTAYADLSGGLPRGVDDMLGTLTPGLGGAVAKALVLAAISVGVTTWLLRKRDMA